MSYQIPLDTIHQLQISVRQEANIPSYDSSGPPFPELPPLEDSISRLDPSPPYLQCKHCKGRLLRGIKSLFCVFCGKEQFGDIPPDPINFRSTTGYRWLLDSLQLDGSEVVELIPEATDRNRGQSTPKDEMPLSELLNLEISWHAEIEKPENTTSEAPPQARSSLNLAGVDLDNFFSEGKGEVTLNQSEEQFSSINTNHANESIAFQGQKDLSLFENAQPSTNPVEPKEHERDNNQSSWVTEFQSAGSAAENKDSRSFDPFAGSQADISTHMDMVFGSANTNSGDAIPSSHSNADDWFQDNLGINSTLAGGFMDLTNSSVDAPDWFQDNQGQSGSTNLNQSKVVDENDDSLEAWDDFTSSTGQGDCPDNTSHEEPIGMNLFSPADDAREIDFGAFQQPDLFSGAINSRTDPENVNKVQSEASTMDRTFSLDEKDGNIAEAVKGEDTTNTRSSKTDVERIMSQMHDLSFMLDSNLSIPQRSSVSED
ncbi:uncharacterized protein LOC116195740 [Punica granatum]|uniref:DUF7815 domain-containing protein n=2 Tax=Punica granatum TaxID=22663 RepID=A0A218WT51_PUNGR|nr:uncharacterized protein LOC116195740 [Punica granatum]OWM75391.1 hypothetical protein CDL15_Pgr021555 [Punica granatum]PKI62221.1 hypothetical protein CRG98_017355 [Punica granatum]